MKKIKDKYLNFVNLPLGKSLSNKLGLPQPVILDRYKKGQPVVDGSLLIGSSVGSVFLRPIHEVFADTKKWASESEKIKAVVYDATGIKNSSELVQLYNYFNPIARKIQKSGKIVIVGLTPDLVSAMDQKIAQRALLGFVKAVGKEFGKGITCNLIYAASDAGNNLKSSLQFFASSRSAFVSGQFVEIKASPNGKSTWDEPLKGKNVLITGAAQGIGKAIAEIMSRDGANVTVVDIPQAENKLREVARSIGGYDLPLDITNPDAEQKIAEKYNSTPLDILIHNAGITRDKRLANMKPDFWSKVIEINLTSQERINAHLIEKGIISSGSKILTISSVSGIAGNNGQTNYSTSKAGVIGLIEAYAPVYSEKGITINAVAPGFIETQMTAAMPFGIREGARRLSALAQGGLPEDVAETIGWLVNPASQGINGQLIRVCGLALVGA